MAEDTSRKRMAHTARSGLLASLAVLIAAAPVFAADRFASQMVELEVSRITAGLDHPWSVEVMPDDAYIVSERPGRLRIIRGGKSGGPIKGLPELFVDGQGGLLDIALSNDFPSSRKLYFTASVPGEGGQGTALFEARLSADEKRLQEVRRLFIMNRLTGTTQHFGSRIAVAEDGSLFFGIGDRGEMDRAQDPKDHAGSILHLDQDGKPAAGNPFADGAKGLPEIWSIGHRNPQGIVIDPADGTLYTVEHGARGGDEINAPKAGGNYGWPVISYGKHYSGAEIGIGQSAKGYEQPIHYWDPSIAPGAIAIYRGPMFPEWEGNFLVAALKYQLLARMERDESNMITKEERLLSGEYGRIRDVKVAPDGSILLLTDEEDGALLRVSRAAAN
ncbi:MULTISPECIES: PQQ-dependent sugar dehydrogenase [Alphaproteobacteria]|uniref:Glucose dehydrogenase n=2 Tax=Alphaproteobacteria TaxID=28211 RepID=A0A512HEM6_9HYPH|nr:MULTISPECIES: PQQ-dependent sugar dehydrogenase [Alphaproteobacteria]GEO83904.1 glucose dehydrogenase [Ciceribacter naphthalenivorans]GLR21218.1 glucose dehydrogenase [Ciceribacter naphthalenivorans]GLT04074.1 glucose dehydrogenase [Sphingomonas psychrolutea]